MCGIYLALLWVGIKLEGLPHSQITAATLAKYLPELHPEKVGKLRCHMGTVITNCMGWKEHDGRLVVPRASRPAAAKEGKDRRRVNLDAVCSLLFILHSTA